MFLLLQGERGIGLRDNGLLCMLYAKLSRLDDEEGVGQVGSFASISVRQLASFSALLTIRDWI